MVVTTEEVPSNELPSMNVTVPLTLPEVAATVLMRVTGVPATAESGSAVSVVTLVPSAGETTRESDAELPVVRLLPG